MANITIESGGSKVVACAQCGRASSTAHGCVYADGDAHAVYFIDWCESHGAQRRASMTLCIGNWGDGAPAADRVSLCITMAAGEMTLAVRPPRDRPRFFGRVPPRAEAARWAEAFDVWHTAREILRCDPQAAIVAAWLHGGTHTAAHRPRA